MNQLNWFPSGKSTLKTGPTASVFFGVSGGVFVNDGNGLLIPASADTVFTVCNLDIKTNENAKTITISRMGTIQPTVTGAC